MSHRSYHRLRNRKRVGKAQRCNLRLIELDRHRDSLWHVYGPNINMILFTIGQLNGLRPDQRNLTIFKNLCDRPRSHQSFSARVRFAVLIYIKLFPKDLARSFPFEAKCNRLCNPLLSRLERESWQPKSPDLVILIFNGQCTNFPCISIRNDISDFHAGPGRHCSVSWYLHMPSQIQRYRRPWGRAGPCKPPSHVELLSKRSLTLTPEFSFDWVPSIPPRRHLPLSCVIGINSSRSTNSVWAEAMGIRSMARAAVIGSIVKYCSKYEKKPR